MPMARRANGEEFEAARGIAAEVNRRGGRFEIVVDDLNERRSLRRFTEASRDR